jgi:outer membrane protein assembly factor BamB
MRLGALLVTAVALGVTGTAQARLPGEPAPRPTVQAVPSTSDWLAYGRDAQLTNEAPQQSITARTAASLHALWRADLGGAIIASPLTFAGVVYAATESGSVVALSAASGSTIWSDTFGSVNTASCGSWGFSSTGAIDPARGVLYVANADGWLRAIDLATGAVVWHMSITNRPTAEYVWGGLRLVGTQLYVPVASYCDAPGADGRFADGRVVAVDVQAHRLDATYDTVPGADNLGGVWGWGGVSVEPDGNGLWTATGNSHVLDASCGCFVDDVGDGNSVVKLSLGLRVLFTDRPDGIPTTLDDDFGAAPVLFDVRGCGSYAAANNKDGNLYIWDREDVGAGPAFRLGIGTASLSPFLGEPSWSRDRQTLYDASTNVVSDGESLGDGVTALTFNASCHLRASWQTAVGDGTQPPPIVLGDVLFAAGGSGGWSVINAATGDVLWHADTASLTLAPPIAADGRIFAGGYDGVLTAFGTG